MQGRGLRHGFRRASQRHYTPRCCALDVRHCTKSNRPALLGRTISSRVCELFAKKCHDGIDAAHVFRSVTIGIASRKSKTQWSCHPLRHVRFSPWDGSDKKLHNCRKNDSRAPPPQRSPFSPCIGERLFGILALLLVPFCGALMRRLPGRVAGSVGVARRGCSQEVARWTRC